MADPITLYNICGKCHGDGQFPNAYIDPITGEVVQPEETVDCPDCDGTGKQSYGLIPASYQEQIDGMQSTINTINSNLLAVDTNVKTAIELCEKILKIVEK